MSLSDPVRSHHLVVLVLDDVAAQELEHTMVDGHIPTGH
jgi:hypothetical protein